MFGSKAKFVLPGISTAFVVPRYTKKLFITYFFFRKGMIKHSKIGRLFKVSLAQLSDCSIGRHSRILCTSPWYSGSVNVAEKPDWSYLGNRLFCVPTFNLNRHRLTVFCVAYLNFQVSFYLQAMVFRIAVERGQDSIIPASEAGIKLTCPVFYADCCRK
jgi:hypothetical protein